MPELTVTMDLTGDLQPVLPLDPLKVFDGSGTFLDMGGVPSGTAQHIVWTVGDVPAGGKAATWFALHVGAGGGTRTVTAQGNIFDPDATNNTGGDTITPDGTLCPSGDFAQKGVDPAGPVCFEDSLFYVVVFQHTGAATADLVDVLDPCLDPATVSALMPDACTRSGAVITCTDVPLDGERPRADLLRCQAGPRLCRGHAGAVITNQAQVTFDDDLQLVTNHAPPINCAAADAVQRTPNAPTATSATAASAAIPRPSAAPTAPLRTQARPATTRDVRRRVQRHGHLCVEAPHTRRHSGRYGTATITQSPTPTVPPPPALRPGAAGRVRAAGAAGPVDVHLRRGIKESRDRLVWKWRDGGQGDLAQFGNPTTNTSYALCVYAGSAQARVMRADAPAGPPWTARANRGYRYIDKSRTPDGLSRIVLRGTSSRNRAQLVVRGVGSDLVMPTLPLQLPVLVQVVTSDGPKCWEATYSSPKKNNDKQFRDKND